ncbi:elongator complex protein 3 [Kosmotoga pacifica]|uniref:Radical SAM protein n=1 Tax=Kosmotoga pacifica TaxID=1330330 RepID=A0A0G2ZHD0_9BACT|nr:radical SAM protein [Kosmotoga pacifica]AKI98218.1 radical SAM protein [Kosmotoga pacifica]
MNIIPLFLPHAGCKTRCVFCNEYSATGIKKLPEEQELFGTVQRYLSYFKDRKNVELAFYGGTFTGLPVDILERYLKFSSEMITKGFVRAIRFSTSPEEITPEKIAMIKRYPVSLVELGVQSFDESVLRNSSRPHGVEEIYHAAELLREAEIPFGIHLMTGLPSDTVEKDLFSTFETVKLGASTCRIHPTVVLKGTILEEKFKAGKYHPQSLEEAIDVLWKMYVILTSGGVHINRVGLCLYGEEVNNIVAGPYHPALGDLIKSRVALEILKLLSEERNSCKLTLPDDNKIRQFFTGYRKYVVENAKDLGLSIEFSRNAPRVDLGYYIDRLNEIIETRAGVF